MRVSRVNYFLKKYLEKSKKNQKKKDIKKRV